MNLSKQLQHLLNQTLESTYYQANINLEKGFLVCNLFAHSFDLIMQNCKF